MPAWQCCYSSCDAGKKLNRFPTSALRQSVMFVLYHAAGDTGCGDAHTGTRTPTSQALQAWPRFTPAHATASATFVHLQTIIAAALRGSTSRGGAPGLPGAFNATHLAHDEDKVRMAGTLIDLHLVQLEADADAHLAIVSTGVPCLTALVPKLVPALLNPGVSGIAKQTTHASRACTYLSVANNLHERRRTVREFERQGRSVQQRTVG